MRYTLLVVGAAACLHFGLERAAIAADLPIKAPAYTPLPYNWSGLYVGANFGGAFSGGTAKFDDAAFDPGPTAFIVGFDLGYNWQFGHFLAGLEGDFYGAVFNRPNVSLATPLGPVQASGNQHWISTLGARFGFTSDKWLYYGKAGGGWIEERAMLNLANGTSWSGLSAKGGWLAGGGLEYAFKPNWTVRLEYDYLGLGNWTASTVPTVTWSRDVQMLTMGVNYTFGNNTRAADVAHGREKYPDTDDGREKLAKDAQTQLRT
jgi:opacity protein-like surface antigen